MSQNTEKIVVAGKILHLTIPEGFFEYHEIAKKTLKSTQNLQLVVQTDAQDQVVAIVFKHPESKQFVRMKIEAFEPIVEDWIVL